MYGKDIIFWPFDDKLPVLASGIEKLTIIIRVVIIFPVSAVILLVFVRFSIIFN